MQACVLADHEAYAELIARCVAVLKERSGGLEQNERDDLGDLLQQYGLEDVVPPQQPDTWRATHLLLVFIPVHISDIDTGDHERDPKTLSRFHGTCAAGLLTAEIHVSEATGWGESQTARKQLGWARGGIVELVFEPTNQLLLCQLSFDVLRTPSPDELGVLLSCLTSNDFFYSGSAEGHRPVRLDHHRSHAAVLKCRRIDYDLTMPDTFFALTNEIDYQAVELTELKGFDESFMLGSGKPIEKYPKKVSFKVEGKAQTRPGPARPGAAAKMKAGSRLPDSLRNTERPRRTKRGTSGGSEQRP